MKLIPTAPAAAARGAVRKPPGSPPPLAWAVIAVGLLGVALWQAELDAQAPAALQTTAAAVAWRISLRFEDRPNGDVVAIDAGSGRELTRYQGEQGFLRGTLRAFARERSRRGVGPAAPLELVETGPGRLSLNDPATGQQIALESFGPSNYAVFAALRTAAASTPSHRSPP